MGCLLGVSRCPHYWCRRRPYQDDAIAPDALPAPGRTTGALTIERPFSAIRGASLHPMAIQRDRERPRAKPLRGVPKRCVAPANPNQNVASPPHVTSAIRPQRTAVDGRSANRPSSALRAMAPQRRDRIRRWSIARGMQAVSVAANTKPFTRHRSPHDGSFGHREATLPGSSIGVPRPGQRIDQGEQPRGAGGRPGCLRRARLDLSHP